MIKIVLRNNTTRRDAVYVVIAVGFRNLDESEYWVTGYWGRWSTFYETDTDCLMSQEMYHGGCKATLMNTVQELVTSKLSHGYRVVSNRSRLPEWTICLHGHRWQDYN